MNHRRPLALLAMTTLLACSAPQANTTPAPEVVTPETQPAQAPVRKDVTQVQAAMLKGPFASLEAFAKAEGAAVLLVDPGSATTQGSWVTQGGVLTIAGATRHVLLGGKAGALYVLPSEGAFTIDTSNTTPDQLKGRAIVREASLPPGYVLFEHIVDYVDATQSGMAHDVLGYSHICREHSGGLACARFKTKLGAYLDNNPGYEMPNAVIKDVEGSEDTLEVFYMNGGDGMSAQGLYKITLP